MRSTSDGDSPRFGTLVAGSWASSRVAERMPGTEANMTPHSPRETCGQIPVLEHNGDFFPWPRATGFR